MTDQAWLAQDALRRAKRREKRQRALLRRPQPVGHLHALRCAGPHAWHNATCTPIPVFTLRVVA